MRYWVWALLVGCFSCSGGFYSDLFYGESNGKLQKEIADAETKLRELQTMSASFPRYEAEVRRACAGKKEIKWLPAPRAESVVKDDLPILLPEYYEKIPEMFRRDDLTARYRDVLKKVRNLDPVVLLVMDLKRKKEACTRRR